MVTKLVEAREADRVPVWLPGGWVLTVARRSFGWWSNRSWEPWLIGPLPDSAVTHFMTLDKSLYLSGPPCPHLVLSISLIFQTFVLWTCWNCSGEPFQKKLWFWRARELSNLSFANRGTESLLTWVCAGFPLLCPAWVSSRSLSPVSAAGGYSWLFLKALCRSTCTSICSEILVILVTFSLSVKGRWLGCKSFHSYIPVYCPLFAYTLFMI